jgi:hypothetical protein
MQLGLSFPMIQFAKNWLGAGRIYGIVIASGNR